ncbi:hypothetical protein QCE62_34500 [Caballeronia sp. LZ033]|uniref:hypothetical protein n=1 Tax=Caballeronia sp. LZ033 TaxID=3038566 RepID=UPI002864CBC1|nr:hypothetical protein [Caballeronia sp. LZ033]MDR5818738.1 hypothetical protein [Caballeronia sp. LZ033]
MLQSTVASQLTMRMRGHYIPAIAAAILGRDGVCPSSWPGDRFDLVWVLDRTNGTGPWSFSQVPQLLLAGDQASVISVSAAAQE